MARWHCEVKGDLKIYWQARELTSERDFDQANKELQAAMDAFVIRQRRYAPDWIIDDVDWQRTKEFATEAVKLVLVIKTRRRDV